MNHSHDQLGLEATELIRKSLEVSGCHTKLLKEIELFPLYFASIQSYHQIMALGSVTNYIPV